MAKKNASIVPPREALPDGEKNRYLAKFKTALCKRWSMTRMQTLYEITDLAMFLWAMERAEEALEVARSVVKAIPAPPPLPGGGCNYNIWCPATVAHALVVHLSDVRSQAEASRAAILANTGISRHNPDHLAEEVAEAKQVAGAATGQDTIKWECQRLARALGTLVLYSELAKAGDPQFKPHAKAAAVLLPKLLSTLGSRLQSGK